MSNAPNVFEVTAENFVDAVIEQSRRVPVLVDFWADWCGPCQMQLPILLKLAEEYGGRFLLGKLDTEQQRDLAREFQIRSIPTMKLFKGGAIVEDILGAQIESTLREILDRHIPRPSDSAREQALQLLAGGDAEGALAALHEIVSADPANHLARVDLAQILLQQGLVDEAAAVVEELPRDVREGAEGAALVAQLEFARDAAGAPDIETLQAAVSAKPEDPEVRFGLAARRVLSGDYEAAFEDLFAIIRADRGFRDDIARKRVLSLFQVLGDQNELTGRYRKRLFNLLH